MSQRATPTSTDSRLPLIGPVRGKSALLACSHRQFVRFSRELVCEGAVQDPFQWVCAPSWAKREQAGPRTGPTSGRFPIRTLSPSRARAVITVATGHCAPRRRTPPRATSLVHQHLKQRRMRRLTPGRPAGISRNAASPRALFCFLPGGFESGRCTPARAGAAPSVRPEPAHIDKHYTTNITDRHQHYRLSRPLPGAFRI